MTIKVAVTGAAGRMGTMVIDAMKAVPEMELVAGFGIAGTGKLLAGGVTVSNASELRDILAQKRPDVLIDFTVPAAAVSNVGIAADLGINLVVGTTGLSKEQQAQMRGAIEGRVAAVITPNFIIGVNVFWKLIEMAAKSLQDYDIEVIESHHCMKKDAPSGTAVAAVNILKRATGIDEVKHGREGIALRGKEIGVHAVRAGDIVGDHIVLFAGPGERLEIRHQAHSRSAFASGAVRAACWVVGAKPGIYSMADVLGSAATP
ncbi:MAG TPA: 4-hydroxy-tetrahydrodipicolinate reductase [Methanotrichaceae archaeon]|nr:4-hydroxy-tetrahydrodipicolinate reductase [Methanotrichaceae archaeon]